MTYYNSAALYGGRNPVGGCGFQGGYDIYDEDYSGGWDFAPVINERESERIKAMGEQVILSVGLTPRQKLLIQWWTTPEGGNVDIGQINFAFGLVKLFDTLRARALTSTPAERRELASRIATLRLRLFGSEPGKSTMPEAQRNLYKLYLKAQKMIHRKPGINKTAARKWIVDPTAKYTRGSWYKALPVPRRMTEAQLANWPNIQAQARSRLEAWRAYYNRMKPASARRERAGKKYTPWEPALEPLTGLTEIPADYNPLGLTRTQLNQAMGLTGEPAQKAARTGTKSR